MTHEPPKRFHAWLQNNLRPREPDCDEDRHDFSAGMFQRELLNMLPRLRAHALVLSRNHDEADDLLQDTCEKALSRQHQFAGSGPLAAWLFRIMQNSWRDKVRAAAVRETDELPPELPGKAARPEDCVGLDEVRRAIAGLPADQRAALLLVAVEGLSYAEAATVMAVPIGTVRSRISRARAALTEQLGMDRDRASR